MAIHIDKDGKVSASVAICAINQFKHSIMKRATVLSLTLHISVILLIILCCMVAKYMSNTPNKHIDIALTKESIAAHIVYLSQSKVSNNTLNSVTNLTAANTQSTQSNKPKQSSTVAYAQLTTIQDTKLKIENQLAKQIKTLSYEHKKKNIEKVKSNKSSPQPINKDHHTIRLNTTSASSAFSSAKEINAIMSELQTALSNYLAKQPSPDKSFSITITLTINDKGILEKINFSPLPPRALQALLIHFLQSQNYTHKLLLPHSIDINIPLELIAASSN